MADKQLPPMEKKEFNAVFSMVDVFNDPLLQSKATPPATI
jgi:hypothetical protein